MTEKGKFLQQFNEAYAKGDTDFLAANVTEDFQWTIVGDQVVQGKANFIKMVEQMQQEGKAELKINNIITHGRGAAVDGTMKFAGQSGQENLYAFCDIYIFSGFRNPKIKTMTSYAIAVSSQ